MVFHDNFSGRVTIKNGEDLINNNLTMGYNLGLCSCTTETTVQFMMTYGII
jgi:hypothetical protein